jgi:single-stranded-DNA-specific exonuclease
VNIVKTIEQCKQHVLKFGGHSQAAGVSVSHDQMDAFCASMDNLIAKELKGKDMTPEIRIDAKISASEIDFDLVTSIEKMKPFGEGNAEPLLLMDHMHIQDMKTVGNGNKHVKFSLKPLDGTPKVFEAIAFNGGVKLDGMGSGDVMDIVCSIQRDEWNGNSKIQLVIEDMKRSSQGV